MREKVDCETLNLWNYACLKFTHGIDLYCDRILNSGMYFTGKNRDLYQLLVIEYICVIQNVKLVF